MGLYDDILEEQPKAAAPQKNETKTGGLYDDILAAPEQQAQPTFADNHPFVASLPEAAKQFGTRAVKSFPEFGKGLNDLVALVGDKTGIDGLSNFGRSNAEFWQEQSDKIKIDPKYQGLQGLAGENWKSTLIPTITGSIGDQATNILTAAGGGAGGAKLAGQLGVKGLAKAGLITAGTSVPNVAQEGSYLDKIQQFQAMNGRMPTLDELKQIQNVALGEKAVNTALETISDRLLFGKLFPEGTATKSVKGIIKGVGQQGLTEAGTEAMQEGVSIGAEKLLGLNNDNFADNMKRVADSAAIGGVVGMGMGGAGSMAAQPYDTQFAQNPNAVSPVQAIQNVSAKIVDGGKVLYDSAADAVNNINNSLNAPDSFDTLMELSRNGDLSNRSIEEIAPNTVKKEKAKKAQKAAEKINNSTNTTAKDTGVPNMVEDGNLYNVSENGESTITSESEVNNVAQNVRETGEDVTATLEKPQPKQQSLKEVRKAAAKKQAIDKIKKLAPNTVEKIEKTNSSGQIVDTSSNSPVISAAKNQDLVKKIVAEGFDENTVNEHIRKLENGEDLGEHNILHTMQARLYKARESGKNNTYNELNTLYNEYRQKRKQQFAEKENTNQEKIEKIAPKTVAKIQETQTENHTDQEGDMVNSAANNEEIEKVAKQYSEMLGQDEVRDFHREFAEALINKKADRIKELVAHGRGFNENSKKMFTKYTGIKLPTTIKGKIETVDKWAAGELTAEQTTETPEKTFDNDNKIIKVAKKDLTRKDGSKTYYISDKYVTNGTIAYDREYFNFANDDTDFSMVDTSRDDMPFNRSFNKTLDTYIEKGKELNTAKLEKPSITKNRGKSYVTFENGGKTIVLDKSYYDTIKDFDLFAVPDENLAALIIRNKGGESIGILMPMQIPAADLEAMKKIAKPIKAHKNEKVYSSAKKSKESEVSNGRSTTQTNGDRSTVSEVQENTNQENSGVSQEQSANERPTDEVGRGNNVSDEQRGISQKDKEIIEKEYKNQHELNKAIEDYINNEEYRKYAGSVNMPQDVKNWLKKYAGAGGLEKQGAEGKGLLSEYYTPQNIVNKMWDLTAQYVNTDGAKVLEPSVGIGRFLETAPKNTNFDVIEMNPVSAKITKILYPDANVTTGEFQERFINKENNTPVKNVTPEYDIVIGNPPYGQYAGRYKGMGEGKKFSRLEAYFINRGLDSLKENGIMTFIVPSSFLDSAITAGKQEIGTKCELVDAYRLPENTFDTTSIGTDIIVLRKTGLKAADKNLNLGNWFKSHPEKILGNVEERKNRFGKMENYVKGDKNAVESIDTSKKDIKETVVAKNATTEKTAAKKINHIANSSKKVNKPAAVVKGKVEYTEYQHENTVSDEDLQTFKDTQVDGTLPYDKYKNEIETNKNVNYYGGELYNNFNYLQGDIYKKLDALERDKSEISKEKYEEQKEKLNSVLPEVKKVGQIMFNPTSDFIREFSLGEKDVDVWDYNIRDYKKVKEQDTLDKRYKEYIDHLTSSERNNVPAWNIKSFIDGDKIRIDYHYSSYMLSDAEKKAERSRQQAEFMTKLKNTVDKTFNDFVKNELTAEEKQQLEDAWNRRFNNIYNPDYNSMPMLVKGLNSEFNGNKLVLQNVQVEGVNFLTNKGVGLLGFEVGVGKTLTGIISTVQNMQMGRCKKPLILVPKQVKDNWIREIHQAFPNIEVNDVDNMSKFKGEIKDNTLTVATYEALGNIWYGENSANDLINQIYAVSNDFNRESTKRGQEKTKERAEQLVGQAEGGNKKLFNIQDIGFDHITIDEAHNFKNLFADAKADGQEGNTYVNITGGSTSTRAARLFLLTQYILNNNGNRNVFMLTATPFNNSPLEVFNMLSYLAKDELDRKGLYNVYQFMENYADITSDWIVNSRNEVEYKQVVKGFKNASSLRELIKNSMLIRSAEDAGIVRPNKHTKRVTLEPSQRQIELIAAAEEEAVNGKKDEGAVLKAINQSRKATLSPDIATDNFDVSPEDFIKNSPKLNYVMSAVESMKKKDSKTSQLIYMPLGVKFLPKMKQYLIDKGVFKADEVAIIDSSVSDDKIVKITDSFNDREGKVKLVIGTNKIKEGMNLNKNSSVLYVPYMDWNPTDFVQIVGRIWRRGNRYGDVRVVVPLLKNSSDSFMFQKLNEKTDRINNIMDENKEYIDTSELNTAEEKINMISNPDKKAKMFIQVQKQKLDAKVKELQGRLETSQAYLNNMKSDERMLKNAEEKFAEYSENLKNIDKESDKWNYEYTERQVNNYKKDIATYKLSLKKIKERIARLELDFEGKDSADVINNEIAKVEEEIKALDKFGEKKLEEFTVEYEKERMNSKTIDDLIKEFEQDTINLYGEKPSNSEDSKPLQADNLKPYERTREAAYTAPVINLETKADKIKKSKTKQRIEKAAQIVDARRYNKALKEGVQKWHSEINIRRYEADRTLNNFINITKGLAKELKVNDKNLREIMPFLRERTDFPEELNRPELKKVWDKVQSTKDMSERLTKLADTASEKFEKFWEEYKAVQASGENIEDKSGVDNYIFHDWKKDESGNTPLLTHAFITKSKHAKQRTIPTYYEGIQGIEQENGEIKQYTPETLDYAELLKKSADNLIKATVDKAFADSVKSFKTSEGANLVLPASQAPSSWVEINHSALNKTVARPVSTSFGEKIAPDLQNKLAELGIAIGRRLPKFKGNGTLNSLGRYVKNEPPEIRLQKWFSNKTLAHEVGHALDDALGLQKSGFVDRHRTELTDLNHDRIEAFAKQGDRKYAEKDTELIAELFGVMFNDIESAYKIAPAATSEVIEKMTNSNMESLLPANYNWADAKHVLEEKVVEFFKMPVRVHPDIAATLKTVFEPKKEYLDILGFKPGKVMDEQTAIMKMMEFSLSGFHNIALTESYLGNVNVGGLKEALNLKKIFNSVKNNEYDVYKNNKIAEQAIRDGLQIGTPLDIDRGTVETVINNAGKWAESHIKGLGKAFSMAASVTEKGIELNNKALWDVIHNNYKLSTYELLVNNETKRKGSPLTAAERKEIAFWVNDSFGGQVMEALGVNPSAKKALSRWLMSPDWLISTTRQFMGIFGSEKGHRKINQLAENSEGWQKVKDITQTLGINSITDDVKATGMRGRIARAFWVRSAILSALYMNILNAMFRMWDKKEYPELYPEKLSAKDYSMFGNSTGAKLYVFIGRNQDGTERYLRLGKQFREVPEMAADPIKHFGAKLSPVIQSGIVAATGHSVGGFENKEISEAKGWKRIGLAAKNLGSKYAPLSVQSAYNKTVKKQGADFTPFDLIGNTSKGMSKYKAKEQFTEAFAHGNKPEKIKEIEVSMAKNGFSKKDIETVEKTAKTSYTKQFKDGYKEALASGDTTKIKKITDTMTKKNISPIDQRKIYTRALSEFYKEKGIN